MNQTKAKETSPVKGQSTLGSQTLPKHKKKVLSKPIANLTNAIDDQLSSLAQAYEF